MGSLTAQVRDAVDRAVAAGDGTAVLSAGPDVVQCLTSSGGVFHIEVLDRSRHHHRTLWQRIRGGSEPAAVPDFDDRQRAGLAHLGFTKADQPGGKRVSAEPRPYVFRAEAGLDSDHAVHIIVTVLHDVFGIRDGSELSVETF